MADVRYTLAQGVDLVDVDFGAVLLNRTNGKYWELNRMGAKILHLLVSGVATETIVHSFAGMYDADRSTISQDVRQLVEGLLDAGVIRTVSS